MKSFASRTRWVVVGIAALSVTLTAVFFYIALSSYVVDERVSQLGAQVTAVASGVEASGGATIPPESDSLGERLFRVNAGLMGAVLYVADENGVVTQSSLEDMDATGRRLPLDELVDEDGDGTFTDVRTAEGERVIVVAVRLDDGGWVVAAQPVSDVRAASTELLVLLAGSVVISLLIALVAAGALSRRLVRPVAGLRAAAEDVAVGEWGRQVESGGDEELASLADSFNRMSSRVADAYSAQKAFVGDVSHELRTPITAIRGWSEALLDGVVADEEREHALRIIRDESGRLGDLTDTLLTLADLDAGVVPVNLGPADVPGILQSLEIRHTPGANHPSMTLEFHDEDKGLRPLADDARLLQIATVLVNNAIAYTPEPGRVRVETGSADGRWCLHVDDSGPGVPVDKREAVFERFSRLDTSRSQGGGGSGLGLAIARRLAELMNGTLTLTQAPELNGARFTLELPVAEDTDGEDGRGFSAT